MYWETVRLLRNAAQLRCSVIYGGREAVDLQDFSEALVAAIADLTKNREFVAPLTICTVGTNGSVIVSRHVLDDNGQMEAEILSEHHRQDERGFMVPINTMVSDARGKIAIIEATADAKTGEGAMKIRSERTAR
jgi:hypothetical protein